MGFKHTVFQVYLLYLAVQLLMLSFDRVNRLKVRARIANNFFAYVFKMNKNHGPIFTVKWLKASSVCLQKHLGENNLDLLERLSPSA